MVVKTLINMQELMMITFSKHLHVAVIVSPHEQLLHVSPSAPFLSAPFTF